MIDFELTTAPSYRVASIVRVGPWKEDNLRTEFGELVRWARRRKIRTGRWIFFERHHHRWEACLEVRGEVAPEGRIRLKTLPASDIAVVTFDPEVVSSRIVYHALNDWTRSRRKDGQIRSVTGVREVYSGDPWGRPHAWSHCRVEFLVKR
jgi:DNA gyrase inhibitor GyrI